MVHMQVAAIFGEVFFPVYPTVDALVIVMLKPLLPLFLIVIAVWDSLFIWLILWVVFARPVFRSPL